MVGAEASAALGGISENAINEASTVGFPPDRRDGYIYVAEAVSGRVEKAKPLRIRGAPCPRWESARARGGGGLPADLADAMDDTRQDDEIRAEGEEALSLTGSDVGTPSSSSIPREARPSSAR